MYFNFAKFSIQESKLDDAYNALLQLASSSYIDPGCYAYKVAKDINNENYLYTLEVWDTLEHLDAHMKTSHIAEFDTKAADFLAASPEVTTVSM